MQLGNKLKVNMCGEYSGRKTLLNWRMSLPLLQLIPIRGIPQPQNKGALPGSQQVCSEIPMEAECWRNWNVVITGVTQLYDVVGGYLYIL